MPSDDAVPMPASAESRRTSLGISAILVPPAPAQPADTTQMSAERGGVVGPASIDAHAPTIPPGVFNVDMLAAAASELSGDWTMTPDADAPVPLVAPTPIVPAGPPTGDWIISKDADAIDGWSAPSKVNRRVATNSGVGPPRLEVASSTPLSSEPKREPVVDDSEPKVQIDPTLIEPLPDLERLGAIDTSELAAPPPPRDSALQPSEFSVDIDFTGQAPPIDMPHPMTPPPMQPAMQPAMHPDMMQAPEMMQGGWMQPPMMQAPPLMYGHHLVPPGVIDPGMPMMPGMPPTNMSPPSGMMAADLPMHRPTPIPTLYTPQPGFAPAVAYPPDPSQHAMPMQVPMPMQMQMPMQMPSEAELATGDSTTVVAGRRSKIIAIIVLLVIAIAGGVYLVMTTGGNRGGDTPAPGSNLASAATPLADASARPVIAPPPVADAAVIADAAPIAIDAAAAPPPPTTCSVKVASFPAGAEVVVDEHVVAHTPGAIDLPCGVETKLWFRKPPLIAQTRVITPKAGVDAPVRVALAKVTFTVKVSSTPTGAAITVNGKAAGVTPSNVKLNAFEAATVVMTKAGYEPFSASITPKQNGQAVHGALKKK